MEDCPSCKSELENGFLAGYQIVWTKHRKEPPKVYTGDFERTGEVYLAYRCSNCNLVLFKIDSGSRVRFTKRRVLDRTPHVDVSYIKRKEMLKEES